MWNKKNLHIENLEKNVHVSVHTLIMDNSVL